MMSFTAIAKIGRMFLAASLSLWVAGAGCMLGCEGMAAAATTEAMASTQQEKNDLSLIVSGEVCATSKSHDCCAERNRTTQPEANSNGKGSATAMESNGITGMADCPLAMSRTVVTAKNPGQDVSSAATVAKSTFPIQHLLEQSATLASPIRLANRGHTYLRCCSFLI